MSAKRTKESALPKQLQLSKARLDELIDDALTDAYGAVLMDDGRAPLTISDAAYTDRMAAQRLKHQATLLHRLSGSRLDVDVEASLWSRREELVTKYACDLADKRFCASLIRGLA